LPREAASLTNGRYTARLNGLGSGSSVWRDVAITRWMPDAVCDADGFHIYLRDLDDNYLWSAGYQPTRVQADEYEFLCDCGAEIVRADRGIECRMAVRVLSQYDCEIRRCQLTNLGTSRRELEVTSYLEWVLGSHEWDSHHPAFSKLFVETSYCPDRKAILARRRPRHSDESELWGFHTIIDGSGANSPDKISVETNRVRFIGRGRTLSRPEAFDRGSVLSGETGSVLDPIAALRIRLGLEPGESREVAFVLGAGSDRADIDRTIEAMSGFAQISQAFEMGAHETNGRADSERIIIHSPHHSFGRAAAGSDADTRYVPAAMDDAAVASADPDATRALQFENGYGGFSRDGSEYVIRLRPESWGGLRRPPLPWVNVIANPRMGFLVTESGAGYTWCGNSRLNRLTAWHNDPVSDPHSEALWIRDEDAGEFWSPLPGPTPAGEYIVRHGFGYTSFEHESHGLSQQTTMFVARDEPVKLTRLRVTNLSGRMRRLSFVSLLHWALGGLASETSGQVVTAYDAKERVIWATNPKREHYGGCVAFSAVRTDKSAGGPLVSFSCDRATFLGLDGEMRTPAAVAASEQLDCRAGQGLDPCAAWQVSIELPAGASVECTYLLGETCDRESALNLIRDYQSREQVERAFEDARQFWKDTLSAITIETPDREIDLVVNGWLLYQNLSCRMWGRSAYYQPGGAFGFRDQLQDASAFVYHAPEITRAQILRHAAQQFIEGDVLHWWHPDTGYGLRTRFSDDLLWLPYVAAEYVQKTGDIGILEEELPFISAPPLAEGQQEAYLRPAASGIRAALYEHCCLALDRGLTRGRQNLPLIGCGDWNDGFSRVGRSGRGESVWLGFFIDHVLERMLPICAERGDDVRFSKYTEYRERLRDALNSAGWDGAWYRRAYYDNGQPIGSASSDECQIDALAQAWAVLSGVAPPDRASLAMEAAEARLVDKDSGMIRLLSPAFDSTPNDPGYIKGYLPGIRENGGQYTHGVLWVVRALAEMGRGTRAVELLQMLSPVWHTRSKEIADIYQTEPYVVAADVYGEPPHVGRGGWTWYTGSAGWMFRVAIESIFGFTTDQGETLVINPSISSAWPQCRLKYRLPDNQTCYEITILNPSGNERGVKSATLDGEPTVVECNAARIPLLRDGKGHHVVVHL
jgi:cyclic beta-1,2-glucan synthetase